MAGPAKPPKGKSQLLKGLVYFFTPLIIGYVSFMGVEYMRDRNLGERREKLIEINRALNPGKYSLSKSSGTNDSSVHENVSNRKEEKLV